jgi:predicted DNA-binding transcriptional regulator
MPKGEKADPEKTEAARRDIESLVKKHGFPAVRRAWTGYAGQHQERQRLEDQRREAEEKLAELDRRLKEHE